MSSMFKKKGGLAFKPKVPVGKARPAAPTRPPQPAKPVEAVAKRISPDPVTEEPENDVSESSRIEPRAERASFPPEDAASPTPPIHARQSSVQAHRPEQPRQTEPQGLPGEATPADGEPSNEEERDELQTVDDISASVSSAQQQTKKKTPAATDMTVEPLRTFTESASVAPVENNAREDVDSGIEESVPATTTPAQAKAKAKPRAKRATAPRTKKTNTDGANENAAAPKKPARKRTRREPGATEDAEDAEDGTQPASRPKQRRRTADISEEISQADDSTPRARSRRARSVTPEDAEEQIVDLQQIKMSDLTRDLRIGKKFSRHDELRERERQKKIKAKLKKDGLDVAEDENGEQTPDREGQSNKNGDSSQSQSGPAAAGPQFRIVDGQIVIDQTSLVMDRHARAAAEQEDMEVIEENDFSRQITSNSYMTTSKLRKGNNWSEADTELFYRGLRMFGTDFEMISKMFKNKVRREVKLKFNREERHNPKAIDAAVMGEKIVKMDLDEYKQLTSSTFESVESIEAEQKKIEEDYEAERQRIADRAAEEMRKKKEALFADDKGGEGGEDGQPAKKKKKSKKQRAQEQGLYGDEEVVDE